MVTTETPLPPQTFTVTRADLIRYAGASGDFNPIHWSDRIAAEVGLPGVIAHGMYTLALAARAVAVWADGGEVVELTAKFVKPVVVPDDDRGVDLKITATVSSVVDGLASLALVVTCGDDKVLGRPRAVIRA